MLPDSYVITSQDLQQALAKEDMTLQPVVENLKLEALANARAYEFAFVVQPVPLKGATGMAVAPVAIR